MKYIIENELRTMVKDLKKIYIDINADMAKLYFTEAENEQIKKIK